MDVDSFENESRKSLFKNKKIPMYMWKQPRTRNVKEVAPVTDMGQDYHKNSCSDTHTRFKADFFFGFFRGGGDTTKNEEKKLYRQDQKSFQIFSSCYLQVSA